MLSHELNAEDRRQIERVLAIRGVFITHTPGYEFNTGASVRLRAAAEQFGYRRRLLATIGDSNGRAVFEIAEFER